MDNSAATAPNPKVEAVIANISQLMAEAELMLNESTSQHAEDQIYLLRARTDTLRTHLASCCTNAGQALAEGARRTDRAIRTHPYQALAIGLGAGLTLGVLLGRRSH